MRLQIGVRPVGAPQYAIRKSLDQTPSKRHNILVGAAFAIQRGRTRFSEALGATDLAPAIFVFAHHSNEQFKLRYVTWLADVRATAEELAVGKTVVLTYRVTGRG